MQDEISSLHERVLSYLSQGVVNGVGQRGEQSPFDAVSPYIKLALEAIDSHFGTDCTHLFLQDIHNPTRLQVSTSSAKETLFRRERYPTTVPCLNEFALQPGKEFELSRDRHLEDRLWALLWETMAIGPYARPWSIVGYPLHESNAATPEPIGYVLFVGSKNWYAENASAVAKAIDVILPDLTWTATVLREVSRLATVWDRLNAYENGELISAGQLHGVLAPLQRMENKLTLTKLRMEHSKPRHEIISGLDEMGGEISEIKRCVIDFLGTRALSQSTGVPRRSGTVSANFKVLIDKHAKSMTDIAKKQGKDFVIRVEDVAPIPISDADFDLVFSNLIHNAIKYGRSNSKIKVTSEVKDNLVIIDVVSYGFGISAPERERIFLPGYRTAEASKIEFTAAGLGLYAARRAAENWGGHLYLKSSEPEFVNPWAMQNNSNNYRNTFRLELPR